MLLLLVGGTCSGKTTIQEELNKKGINKIITYTTRKMRPGESVDTYHFVSDKEFHTLEGMGYFAEVTSYEVADGSTLWYGTGKEDLEQDGVLIVNPYGLRAIKKLNIPYVAIHIYAEEDIVWNRLRNRGDSSNEARRRIEADKLDFEGIRDEVDVSINNDGKLSIEEISDIVSVIYERAVKYEKIRSGEYEE